MPRKIIAFIICFCLIFEQAGFAQVAPQLGIPAYLQNLAPVADKFRPIHLRSLSFDQSTNNVNLLLDKGDAKSLQKPQIEATTKKLLEYFKIGLTLPNSMFWVNLRPDAPTDIIDPYVEQTDLGQVLLEADLQLKKDMAQFTSPKTPEGKQYWDKLYEKAESLYGQMDMEIPTITRPWIVPGEIIIGESKDGAYIYKATLKVMLEQDYLKDTTFYNFDDERAKQLNEYSSQILREMIIPKLTREVNASKRYASLRQVYYSLVLAQWFKQRHSPSLRGVPQSGTTKQSLFQTIDAKDLTGLTSTTKWSKDKYYQAYKKSFSQGEYNLRETCNTKYGMTVRQYFSGGVQITDPAALTFDSSTGTSFEGAGAVMRVIATPYKIITVEEPAQPSEQQLQEDVGNADVSRDLSARDGGRAASKNMLNTLVKYLYKIANFLFALDKKEQYSKAEEGGNRRIFWFDALVLTGALVIVITSPIGLIPAFIAALGYLSAWNLHYFLAFLFGVQGINHVYLKTRGASYQQTDQHMSKTFFAVYFLIGPILEEIESCFIYFNIFRGLWVYLLGLNQPIDYVLPILGVSIGAGLPLGIILSIAGSAAIFYYTHDATERKEWLLLLVFGAVNPALYYITGSLLVPIFVHSLVNIADFAARKGADVAADAVNNAASTFDSSTQYPGKDGGTLIIQIYKQMRDGFPVVIMGLFIGSLFVVTAYPLWLTPLILFGLPTIPAMFLETMSALFSAQELLINNYNPLAVKSVNWRMFADTLDGALDLRSDVADWYKNTGRICLLPFASILVGAELMVDVLVSAAKICAASIRSLLAGKTSVVDFRRIIRQENVVGAKIRAVRFAYKQNGINPGKQTANLFQRLVFVERCDPADELTQLRRQFVMYEISADLIRRGAEVQDAIDYKDTSANNLFLAPDTVFYRMLEKNPLWRIDPASIQDTVKKLQESNDVIYNTSEYKEQLEELLYSFLSRKNYVWKKRLDSQEGSALNELIRQYPNPDYQPGGKYYSGIIPYTPPYINYFILKLADMYLEEGPEGQYLPKNFIVSDMLDLQKNAGYDGKKYQNFIIEDMLSRKIVEKVPQGDNYKLTQGFIDSIASLVVKGYETIDPAAAGALPENANILYIAGKPHVSARISAVARQAEDRLSQKDGGSGIGKKARKALAELAKKDKRLKPALQLEEDISDLEKKITALGLKELPEKIGFHGGRNGRPEGEKGKWWYFYFDKSFDFELSGRARAGSVPMGFHPQRDMPAAEFFERLQGTILMTYGYSSRMQKSLPAISILLDNPAADFQIRFHSSKSDNEAVLDLYGPGQDHALPRYFYLEGLVDYKPGIVAQMLSLDDAEVQAAREWTNCYVEITGLPNGYYDNGEWVEETDTKMVRQVYDYHLNQYFICRMLYKRALESFQTMGIVGADSGKQITSDHVKKDGGGPHKYISSADLKALQSIILSATMGEESRHALRSLGIYAYESRDPAAIAMLSEIQTYLPAHDPILRQMATGFLWDIYAGSREKMWKVLPQAMMAKIIRRVVDDGDPQSVRIFNAYFRAHPALAKMLLANLGYVMVDGRIIDNPESYASEEELRTGNGKKLALVICPTADYNEGFNDGWETINMLKEQGYAVRFSRVGSEEELISFVDRATRDWKASLMIVAGHGSQDCLELDDPVLSAAYTTLQIKGLLGGIIGELKKKPCKNETSDTVAQISRELEFIREYKVEPWNPSPVSLREKCAELDALVQKIEGLLASSEWSLLRQRIEDALNNGIDPALNQRLYEVVYWLELLSDISGEKASITIENADALASIKDRLEVDAQLFLKSCATGRGANNQGAISPEAFRFVVKDDKIPVLVSDLQARGYIDADGKLTEDWFKVAYNWRDFQISDEFESQRKRIYLALADSHNRNLANKLNAVLEVELFAATKVSSEYFYTFNPETKRLSAITHLSHDNYELPSWTPAEVNGYLKKGRKEDSLSGQEQTAPDLFGSLFPQRSQENHDRFVRGMIVVDKTYHILPSQEQRFERASQKDGGRGSIKAKIKKLQDALRQLENKTAPTVINFGDKHGASADLERILKMAQKAVQEGRPLVITGHGDVFDRGSNNRRNFDILQELKKLALASPLLEVHFNLGNHDEMLIQAFLLGDELAGRSWRMNGGAQVLQEFGDDAEVKCKEMAEWVLQNCDLFTVDERGFLHLHAGIPIDAGGNPLISWSELEAMKAEWLEIRGQAAKGELDKERLGKFFAKAEKILWIREDGWIDKLMKGEKVIIDQVNKKRLMDLLRDALNKQFFDREETEIEGLVQERWMDLLLRNQDFFRKQGIAFEIPPGKAEIDVQKIDTMLAQLGVNGIVFGHIHLKELLNIDNRIFCVDVEEGDPGHLIFNSEGLRFDGLRRSTEDLVASNGELLASMNAEIIRLKKRLGVDSSAEEALLQTHSQTAAQERSEMENRLASRHQEVVFVKNQMRRFHLGLRVSWGPQGLFSFVARESTRIHGGLRIQNIAIGDRNIARVVLDNGSHGDSLLIQEGEALVVGRIEDNANNAYFFAAGEKLFVVEWTQNASHFILRERPDLNARVMNMRISRTMVNSRDDILVTTEEAATTPTSIDPVITAASRQEAVEVLGEIVKYLEDDIPGRRKGEFGSVAAKDGGIIIYQSKLGPGHGMPRLIATDGKGTILADIYVRRHLDDKTIIIRWYSDAPIKSGDMVDGKRIEDVLLGLAQIGKLYAPESEFRMLPPQEITEKCLANPDTRILASGLLIIDNWASQGKIGMSLVIKDGTTALIGFEGQGNEDLQLFVEREILNKSVNRAQILKLLKERQVSVQNNNKNEKNKVSSSPPQPLRRLELGQTNLERKFRDGGTPDDHGGVDFRALPILTKPAGSIRSVGNLNIPVAVDPKVAVALNKEWNEIQSKMQKGLMPYKEIKEYVARCNKEQAREQIYQVFAYIANILRLEEDAAVSTPPELKEILTTIG